MNAAICTLFEGHYHFGVATLANSLYHNGYRGVLYVGYRGNLPTWVLEGKKATVGKWTEAIILNPADGIQLVFLRLATPYSLTNYKPDFMLELWDSPAKDAEALFYFDPDIVVNDPWACFEQWVNCGVALCEDIDSPLPQYHPRRQGWRNYYKDFNIDLKFKSEIYVNGGFIGLVKEDISFLKMWTSIQDKLGLAIGGLENSIFSNHSVKSTLLQREGFTIFDKSDQDALNATVEAFNGAISCIGKEGMGFKMGHTTMFHALGDNKPWHRNYLLNAFKGKPPRHLDLFYWQSENYPIVAHSSWQRQKKIFAIKIAKFISRFYSVK